MGAGLRFHLSGLVVLVSFSWITFVKNLWKDGSGLAFDDAGDPTAYFWVHLTLAVVSFVLGTVVGAIGLRGVRALRRTS
ncbi:SCO4848 family membrane protein [Streptomyces sp. NPDC055099]